MKLICLGTGHAGMIKNYNTCFVLENGGGFACRCGRRKSNPGVT